MFRAPLAILLLAGTLAGEAGAGSGMLSGRKFEDINLDGDRDGNEPGLPGWVIFIDANGDGVLNHAQQIGLCDGGAREVCAITGASGAYALPAAGPGSYRLAEVAQAGWAQTRAPAAVTLAAAGESREGLDFGNALHGSVAGTSFDDGDGDGVRDSGERGIDGLTVYADRDDDGAVGEGEPTAVTSGGGAYLLAAALPPGTTRVRQVLRCGFQATAPATAAHDVTLAESGALAGGRDFGNRLPARLPGDANGDGIVSVADLVAVTRARADGSLGAADVSGDGEIDEDDLTAVRGNRYECAGLRLAPRTPTPTATAAHTTTAAPSATGNPPPTATHSATHSATPSALPTDGAPSPTASRTQTPAMPATPSATPTSAAATATRTRTATPTIAGPTATPTGVPADGGAIASGSVAGAAAGAGVIPSLLASIISGVQFGDSSAAFQLASLPGIAAAPLDSGGGAGACPLGGTATRGCSGLGSVTLAVALDACTLATTTGSVRTDGSVALTGSGFCPKFVLPPFTAATDVQAGYRNGGGALLQTATSEVNGSINPDLGGSCFVTGGDLVLSGTLAMQYAGGRGVAMQLMQTAIDANAAAFNPDCLPVDLSLKFDGAATLRSLGGSGGGGAAAASDVPVVFTAFTVRQDARAQEAQIQINGGIASACFGGSATVTTLETLVQALGSPCPRAGRLRIQAPAGTVQVHYLADGSVGFDRDLDGSIDPGATVPSCLDPSLLTCEPPATPTVTGAATVTRTATEIPSATPSATSLPTETETAVPTATDTATRTLVPTRTPTPSPSRTATLTQTGAPTATRTATQPDGPTPTATSVPSDTATPAATATGAAAETDTPTATATEVETPTETATRTHTQTPPVPSTPTRTATATATDTITRSPTTTRTSTHTASATVTRTASATPTATASPTGTARELLYCDTPATPLSIPDNSAAGTSRSLVINDADRIGDLDVRVTLAHTWVGDLKVALTHVQTGTKVMLVDLPGVPATVAGCSANGIAATFDDGVADAAENECSPHGTAIYGAVRPFAELAAFAGENIAGTWRLDLADLASGDLGTLTSWCLEVNSRAPRVTAFTCEGERDCQIGLDQPFDLSFSYIDPDADATQWSITSYAAGGASTSGGQGPISPPGEIGTVPLVNGGYACPSGNCSTTEFDWDIVVLDATARQSPPRRVHITVLGSGG